MTKPDLHTKDALFIWSNGKLERKQIQCLPGEWPRRWEVPILTPGTLTEAAKDSNTAACDARTVVFEGFSNYEGTRAVYIERGSTFPALSRST